MSSTGEPCFGAEVICCIEVLLSPDLERDGTCFRDVELLLRGTSFLAAKLRGLLPRTITAPERDSAIENFSPVDTVAITFRCSVKCCCSSFLRPLLAVAIRNCSRFHCMGIVLKSESMSDPASLSKAMVGGSFSDLSSCFTGSEPLGVFQGTDIIFTGFPSTDSVADTDSSNS